MPLRFRSVVPYTLPGVLMLIGWWWYISRKKERITNHKSLEEIPVTGGSLTSPTEGSNGLVEESPVSPTNDTTAPINQCSSRDGPVKVKNKTTTQYEGTAQIYLPDSNAELVAPYLGTVETDPENIDPLLTVLHSIDNENSDFHVSENSCKDLEESPLSVLIMEPGGEVEERAQESMLEASISPFQSAQFDQVKDAYSTSAKLAKAERPDPEGEVASQEVAATCVSQPLTDCQMAIGPKNEMLSKLTLGKALNVTTLEEDYQEMITPLQGFQQHILTSTPIYSAHAHAELTTPCHASEDSNQHPQQLCSNKEEEMALMAAGLITEVISAATQEVFGVTSCQDTDGRQPSCTTLLANGRPFTKQEPITTVNTQQHLGRDSPSPIGHELRAAKFAEEDKQGILNGFSSAIVWEPIKVGHGENDVENAWRGHRPMVPPVIQLPNPLTKNAVEELVSVEDSACSTCLSEDGVSEDDHTSRPGNSVDLFNDTGESIQESTPPHQLAEEANEAAVLDLTGGNTLDDLCEMKRLNGIGLRNGGHRTGEVETDQSGGSDVNSMDSVDSGCTMGALDSQSNHAVVSGSELIIWEIEVPKHLVGRLIGKQGRYVSFLKQNSAAKIYISTLPYTQEYQICHIEGTQQQVDKALSLICKKFKDMDLTNLYAPPPPLTLPSLPMTSWLLLPSGVTVEVIVVNIVSAGHVFVQQHTHPTFHALRSLDQQMFLCYSQPGTPTLPSPELGVICAAPAVEGAWWRAQVITFYKETNEVEIRYVDYGGYERVKIDTLRQIRSDFVTLPFQGAEVLLDNIAPLPGEDRFSTEANSALEDLTRGVALLSQVSNYDINTGLPHIQLWNMVGDEPISVNRTLAERGFSTWVDGF